MIKVEHVAKSFGSHQVLTDVSFSVSQGSIYGLIGHNGAGKTTLLSIMTGLIKADSGACRFGGDRISYLPDVPGYFDYLTAEEYLLFLQSGLKGKAMRDPAQLLKEVGLSPSIRIRAMSRGMRQRLGIASALVSDPPIILLDEPTSALDPSGRMELLAILKRLRDEGKAIVLSTHVLADMEKVCDTVGFLYGGQIRRTVNISELGDSCTWIITFQRPIHDDPALDGLAEGRIDEHTLRVTFGKQQLMVDQRRVLDMLRRADTPITAIQNESHSLDAIFQEVCHL